jgi:hypothetical protein
MKRLIVLIMIILIVGCEVDKNKVNQLPSMLEIEPYLVFAEDDGTLLGVASHLDFKVRNDSIFLDNQLIGVYQENIQ